MSTATEYERYLEDLTLTTREQAERTCERVNLKLQLADGFIKLQKERNPAARQAQWVELQRLAGEIERLSERAHSIAHNLNPLTVERKTIK